jgi:hypothetical protein
LALNAGTSVLVFKVVNQTRPWQARIRITEANGQPVGGLNVTPDADAAQAQPGKRP